MSRATTYAQLLADKAPGCQILAQVGAFELITSWTAAGGGYTNTWKKTITQRQHIHNFRTIRTVTFGDPALNPPVAVTLAVQTSIANVDANLGSFYFDASASILYVSLAAAANPNNQKAYAGFNLYFSTGDPHQAGRCFIEETTQTVYYPYICEAPGTTKALEDPFIGSITTGTATLGLASATGLLDAIWRLYVWQYGTVVVMFGGADLPLSEYATLFTGSTSDKSWNDGVARLHLVDGCDPLLATVAGASVVSADITNLIAYTGDGSYGYGYQAASSQYSGFTVDATTVWGGATAPLQVVEVGQPKPIVYGVVKGFPAQLVSMDTTNTTKQIAIVCLNDTGYRNITQVYVGGLTTRVSWWISKQTGFLAVMLTLGGGAASSISAGITVDFEGTGTPRTATMTIASPCVVTLDDHGFSTDRPVVFATTGALPTGITAGTIYYVKAINVDTFNLAATPGGASINTSGSQSGGHLCQAILRNPADIVEALCTSLRSSAVSSVAPDFGGGTGPTSIDPTIEIDFVTPGPATSPPITAADWSTPVTFSSPTGVFAVPINSQYPTFDSCVDTTWPPTSRWVQRMNSGLNRPATSGSYTAYNPQFWCKMRTTSSINPPYNYTFKEDGTYSFDPSFRKFTAVLVCVGTSYTSISAIRVNGSADNVGWYGSASNGLIWVFKISTSAPVSTGQIIQLDPEVLAASRVLCDDYELGVTITTATTLRDVLMRIARDTLSYVYVSNAGLICFHTYEPSTADEEELTQDTGDFLVSPDVAEPAERCYRAIQVEYAYDTNRANRNGGNYLTASYTVAESIGLLTGRTTDFPVYASYHATSASALLLAKRLAKLLSRGAPTYKVVAPIKCMNWDLGDKVSVERDRLPVAVPGTDVAHCYVTRITRDLETMQVTLELTENLIADLLGGW